MVFNKKTKFWGNARFKTQVQIKNENLKHSRFEKDTCQYRVNPANTLMILKLYEKYLLLKNGNLLNEKNKSKYQQSRRSPIVSKGKGTRTSPALGFLVLAPGTSLVTLGHIALISLAC